MMNRFERSPPDEEAVIEYLDGDYTVVRPGSFVRCGVTDEKILIDDLRYWSVDLQEAYASTDAVLQRVKEQSQAHRD
jgi:hypothetical protein